MSYNATKKVKETKHTHTHIYRTKKTFLSPVMQFFLHFFSDKNFSFFLVFIHDDMDFDDDPLNLMINYAYAYFLYIHLLYVDAVVDIENERTLYYP
jgi:hypothetical protein